MRKFLSLFAVLVVFCITAFSQTKNVSGRVTDQQGQPVPFASVRIKGSKIGVSADADGNFTIKVDPNGVLVISGTGIRQKDFPVSNQGALVLQVSREASSLTEVVVTSLGIKKEAKALGYSATTISSDVLNVSKPLNAETGLIGQVSGAQISVTNNGVDPSIVVQLRGERHISSSNEPLFIVDGMEVRSDYIATLNPEDVESVSVLKSASAAALYGSEATNGVIIYTTKKGSRNGKATVNLTQTVTLEHLAYEPALQTTYSGYGGEAGVYLSGTPYQFYALNPYTDATTYVPFENQSFGEPFNGSAANSYVGIPNAQGQVLHVPFEPQKGGLLNEFFKTGITSQTDVSLSTGDVKNSSFIGLQYADIKGTLPDDEATRGTVTIGGRRTYGIFNYNYNMSYGYKYTNTVGNDITGGWPIYWTLLNTQANFPLSQLKDWQDPNSFGNLNNYPNAYYINPWWQVANSRVINHYDNFLGSVDLNLKPTSWFTATYRLSAQVTNNILKAYRNQATFTSFAEQNFGPPIYGTPLSGTIQGALEDKDILYRRLQQDILLTFQKKFGDIGSTLIVGNTIWDRYSNTQIQSVGNVIGDDISGAGSAQGQTNGLFAPGIYNISNRFGLVQTGAPLTSNGGIAGIQDSRLIGYYADLTLDYNEFIFAHGNFRRDYSSLLAPGNNAYNVYGGDVSWVFSENFTALKNSSFFSFGKLRAAYSHTGQITLNPYATVNTFTVPQPYPYGGLSALALSGTYNNPNNVPEATKEVESGIEFGLMGNRITGAVTYYHDVNYNQLFTVGLTSATGFNSASLNAAQTTSHGWEFDLSDQVIKTKNWSWSMRGNFAVNSTVVDKLYGTGTSATTQTSIGNNNEAIVGMTFPQLYVQDFVRDSATHKVIVDPYTGMPSVAQGLVAVGRTTPKYILGLTSTLTWQNLTLQIVADYRGGYVFYNATEKSLDFPGTAANTVANGRQNFIFPNSEVMQNGKLVPNTNTYVEDGNINFWAYFMSDQPIQTPYVESAAAWKVRTVSLTYDFTKLIGSQLKFFKGVSLSVIVNNALMFRPKENNFTDPEFNIDNSNALGNNTFYELPSTRQYTGVVKFTF